MPAALSADLKNQAKVLYLSGKEPVTIETELGVQSQTVYQWIKRYGWKEIRTSINSHVQVALSQAVTSSLVKQGKDLRKSLATELQQQADALASKPVKDASELANEGQGRASVVKTLVEAASKVYGWDNENQSGIAFDLRALDAVDVEEVKAIEPPKTE